MFEIRRLQKWNASIAEACALKTERRATAGSATSANHVIENNRHYIVSYHNIKSSAAKRKKEIESRRLNEECI